MELEIYNNLMMESFEQTLGVLVWLGIGWMLFFTWAVLKALGPKPLPSDIYKLHAEACAGYHPAANWSFVVARRHQQ